MSVIVKKDYVSIGYRENKQYKRIFLQKYLFGMISWQMWKNPEHLTVSKRVLIYWNSWLKWTKYWIKVLFILNKFRKKRSDMGRDSGIFRNKARKEVFDFRDKKSFKTPFSRLFKI